MNTMPFRWLVLGLAVFVTACAQPPVPQDRYYRIDVADPQPGPRILDGVVEIDRMSAEGLISGRAVVYSEAASPTLVQEYYYDYWTEPPSDMLRDALIDYLRAADAAEAVVTPESRVDSDFTLNGRIHRIEHVRGGEPKGIVDIELSVTHTRTGKLMMVRSYAVGVGATDGSVSSAVLAINQGVAAIFERFLADLQAAR